MGCICQLDTCVALLLLGCAGVGATCCWCCCRARGCCCALSAGVWVFWAVPGPLAASLTAPCASAVMPLGCCVGLPCCWSPCVEEGSCGDGALLQNNRNMLVSQLGKQRADAYTACPQCSSMCTISECAHAVLPAGKACLRAQHKGVLQQLGPIEAL
jgi:hypothetical protein